MSEARVEVRRYGSWTSPITAERIAGGAVRLGQPRVDGGRIAWIESRPTEGGRQVVMAARPGGPAEALTPDDVNVRTKVHEYGGAEYELGGGQLFAVDFTTQQVRAPGGVQLGTPGARYADLEISPDGRWLVAVEERAREGDEPENRLVVWRLGEGTAPRAFAVGHDFVSFPRFSPDGRRLAFTAWEHPDMPWDATALYVVDWGDAGPEGSPRRVAGVADESIFQPSFSPSGALTFVSDRSGWWNLYAFSSADAGAAGGAARPLCPRSAEFGRPQWVFGLSSYAYLDDGRILCRYGEACHDRLARLDPESGRLEPIDVPYTWIDGIRVEGSLACLMGAAPDRSAEIAALDLESDTIRVMRSSGPEGLDASLLSAPEELEFESAGGRRAYAFFYAPHNPAFRAPEGERPPLIVKSHGGPTGATQPVLDLRIQYWTSRGFAVVDVNYGGSTGYGRPYRDLLRGQWGVVDVDDCVHAARTLADQGRVDAARMAISGGSAGGFTTLAALTFHDTFAAGASHYGIGDLAALARDTHKFESRYTDRLVAPWRDGTEADHALYRERSPIHHVDRLSCPVIFFQGLEDAVVPPSQAEAMVEALARRGIAHAYVPFAGEQHGFRRAENIRTALDGELYFYSQIFGFDVDVRPAGVEIVGAGQGSAGT